MATDFPKKGDDKKISLRNSNYPLFDRNFAKAIKKDDPKIWKAGGNIEGNNSYRLLLRALDGDDSPAVLRKIKEREAWASRHFEDGAQFKSGDKKARPSNIAGVVAQIKWLVIGTLGEQKMKDVILEAVKYLEDKEDRAMERQVSAKEEKGIRNKLEEHNAEYGDDPRKRGTYRMFKAVFERGLGAYKNNPSSVRPSVQSASQWAFARLNAFIFTLRNLRFPSKNKFDTDLLPKAHPLSSKENGDRIQNMDTEQRHIKDIRETDESYIVEFAKAKEEKMEMEEEERPYHDDEEKRPYHDEEEEKDKKGMKDEEERAEELDQDVRDFYAEEGLRRDFEFDRNKIDEEKRTVTIGVSSEEPVQRRFGFEVLGHTD